MLELTGEDKIDWDRVKPGEWKRPCDMCDIICHVPISVWFKAKNGKEYLSQAAGCAVIYKDELVKNSYDDIKKLKKIRLISAMKSLKVVIRNELIGRKGLRFHKGRFDFQSVRLHECHY